MHPQVREQIGFSLWSRSFLFIMLSNALMFMAFEMLLPTLPLFVTHIGGNPSQIGLVTGVFMFSAIGIRPFTTYLAARIDKKYLLIIGIAISALMTGAYYLAETVAGILVFRIIHGIGFGLATTFFATLAAENIPKDRRGEGMGYFGVGETVAISVGPLLGTAMMLQYDFYGLFFGGMALLLLALVMAIFVRRRPEAAQAERGEVSKIKLIEPKVLFPSILMMMIGIAIGAVMSFIALYAAEKQLGNVAWFFFVTALAGFAVRLVSGRLFDRHGPGAVVIPASVLLIAGLWVVVLAQDATVFLLAATLYGMGFGALFPALQTWCINLVEEHEHEHAMSTFFNFFDLGIGGGSMIMGIVAAAYSYTIIYYVAIIVVFLQLVLYISYARRNTRQMNRKQI